MTEPGAARTADTRSQAGESPDRRGQVPLRLRIGITGHRDITADHPGITVEIAKAVEYITQVLTADPGAMVSADPAQENPEGIVLTVVSSLAEGTDRVVTGEILKRKGAQLEAVLPRAPAGRLPWRLVAAPRADRFPAVA